MPRAFVTHPVQDFDSWRPIYQGDAGRRQAAGLTDVALFREVGNDNNVLMVWEYDDPSGLVAMLSDPDLGATMEQAGVLAPPVAFGGDALG